MDPWRWLVSMNAHELDALRTAANVIGLAFVPIIGLLVGWAVKLLRITARNAEAAKRQTAHAEHIDGKLRTIGVVEYARRAVNAGEAARHETGDLAQWLRGNGRYRMPTSDIPRQEPSHYE